MEVIDLLKKRIQEYIGQKMDQNNTGIELYSDEKEYALKHGIIDEEKITINVLSPAKRFSNAYIERGDKETEEFLSEEKEEFLKQPISYFKTHKNEFMYIETEWWNLVGADAVSFEQDNVFGNYDVMLGLKLQKKYDQALRNFLSGNLKGEEAAFDLMFDGNEGIWSLNFSLNALENYQDELVIEEALSLIYSFLFKLAESVEKL
jgi:hypothetical protein